MPSLEPEPRIQDIAEPIPQQVDPRTVTMMQRPGRGTTTGVRR
jgi:hypothetical protein